MSPKTDPFAHVKRGWHQAGRKRMAEAMNDVHRESTPETFYESGRVFADETIEALPPDRYPTIIELGAGLGRVTQYLQHHYDTVYAVDIAPSMAQHLRESIKGGTLNAGHVTVIEDDGTGLANKITEVDAVYSSLVLMHNTRQGVHAIFDHLFDVIRPNGRIAFQLPVYDRPIEVDIWNHVAQWTFDEVEALAIDHGYIPKLIHTNPGTYTARRKWETIGPHHFDLHIFIRP